LLPDEVQKQIQSRYQVVKARGKPSIISLHVAFTDAVESVPYQQTSLLDGTEDTGVPTPE
jgi:hypothetical protein